MHISIAFGNLAVAVPALHRSGGEAGGRAASPERLMAVRPASRGCGRGQTDRPERAAIHPPGLSGPLPGARQAGAARLSGKDKVARERTVALAALRGALGSRSVFGVKGGAEGIGAVFAAADRDGSGDIDTVEFRGILTRLGLGLSAQVRCSWHRGHGMQTGTVLCSVTARQCSCSNHSIAPKLERRTFTLNSPGLV